MSKKQRAFFKWAGGKYALLDAILARLPHGDVLVEPFLGAGSVFLNSSFKSYILADINPDLIGFYKLLQSCPDRVIQDARLFFVSKNNDKKRYYAFRQQFNQTTDSYERALLFLYLNRHGYNGLCRYNKSGAFNVPFGSYIKPYYPEKELWFFAEKAQKARFFCEDYRQTFTRAQYGHVIYCDPPYAPLSSTANFTGYVNHPFTINEQRYLAYLAERAAGECKIPVLISNHDTQLTRELYAQAQLDVIRVQRYISRHGHTRCKVRELLAYYSNISTVIEKIHCAR